ncbi:cupin domain-containing protein [Pseudoalteromonas piscicida]|uniref:cupin domain-containing protein n=1 Tax=Pseudoalteromonas piscicida TaxID=43662 RepID=UPI0027386DA6|nr:cupin domain-containing protein [Pseudoalteromonas piscicida]MDP4487377.1 cupin domain-containing protein [Pseudoalteromonas piscicida]
MEKYIVSKAEIEALKGEKRVHFLNPNAQRLNKSLGDLTGITGFGFHIIEIQPGFDSTETHMHYHEDECVYILQGTAEAYIGDEVIGVGEGDFIGYRACGKPHKLVNNSDVTLRCIVVGQRLPHDVGDYTMQGKRIYRQKGLPWNVVDINDIMEPMKNNQDNNND